MTPCSPPGRPGPRTATRVVLTATGEGMPEKCRLLESVQAAPILIVTSIGSAEKLALWRERGAEVLEQPASATGILDVGSLLTELAGRGMTNVLVEGGAGTLGGFRDAGEIDEVHAFIAQNCSAVRGPGRRSQVRYCGNRRSD